MAVRFADTMQKRLQETGSGFARLRGLPDDPVQAAEQVYRRAEQAADYTAKVAADAADVRDRARAHLESVRGSDAPGPRNMRPL